MVADLVSFFKWYEHEPTARSGDAEYAAADFIYWSKKQVAESPSNGSEKLGHGVEAPQKDWQKPRHGDIEYTYEVKFRDNQTYLSIYAVHSGEIMFNGTLSQAYRRFVLEDEEARKVKA